MEIIEKMSTNRVCFGDLTVGECFKYKSLVYLKIGVARGYEIDIINAIDLSDGTSTYFADLEEVIPLEAQITICPAM